MYLQHSACAHTCQLSLKGHRTNKKGFNMKTIISANPKIVDNDND